MDGEMVLETEVEWLGRPTNNIFPLIHTTNVYGTVSETDDLRQWRSNRRCHPEPVEG
jgi:hypothetical protein